MNWPCFWRQLCTGLAALCILHSVSAEPPTNHFSLGLGYGEYGNLLRQTSNDRLVLMPRWQWYHDRIYIENLDVGLNVLEADAWSLDLSTQQSYDALLTRQGGLQNALIKGLADVPIITPVEVPYDASPTVYIYPQARQLSYLAGLSLWYRHGAWQLQQSWHTDISGVHHGQQWQTKLRWHTEQGPLGLGAEIGLRYLDANYSNYYFGVSASDTLHGLYQFSPAAHWLPSYQLNARWQLADSWQWIISWRREHLPSAWLQNRYFDRQLHQVWFSGVFYTW